ncbi:MAG: xanthine dehydrogenase family protein subunit M [Deltaproteobacteria bacterium]|nr:xanthine dehydrogenase family protein subunit M [Deltaproteobacteria bacterium]
MTSVPSYYRPTSLSEALRLKEEVPGARFIAGGTDLLVQLRDGGPQPAALISLRHIPELSVTTVDGTARLGATTPLSDLVDNAALMAGWPLLGEALRDFGSVQIRNSATVGGNLCNGSPAADMAPVLMVLRAQVRLCDPGGERTLPLEEFFEGPGRTRAGRNTLLTAVELAAPTPGQRGTYLKKMRTAMDVALASVAALAVLEEGRLSEVRLAAGSVAPVPLRLSRTEAVLRGQQPTPERIAEARRVASQEVCPITDLRAGADYRRHIVGVFVQRALQAVLQEDC